LVDRRKAKSKSPRTKKIGFVLLREKNARAKTALGRFREKALTYLSNRKREERFFHEEGSRGKIRLRAKE